MGRVAKDTIEIGVVLQGGGALGAYEVRRDDCAA